MRLELLQRGINKRQRAYIGTLKRVCVTIVALKM